MQNSGNIDWTTANAGLIANTFIGWFTSILYEALPFIILGAVLAGVLEELVPQRLVTRVIGWLDEFLPPSLVRLCAILLGGLLGLVFPMCECGIIPVMRRLLRKGLPLSCCVSYLLAGPIINGVVMLSTAVAFSGSSGNEVPGSESWMSVGPLWMVSMRMGVGYLVAIGTALIVEWQYRRHGDKLLAPLAIPAKQPELAEDDEDNGAGAPRRSLWERIAAISETSLHDFVDITVFLILGALVAAAVRLGLSYLLYRGWTGLSDQYWVLSILMLMGLAIVLCLCSEADAFVAANLQVIPAAKLAFLVLGPMLDFKLYFMYTRVFRPRLIWTIIVSVVVQVFVYAVLVHLWEAGVAQRSLSALFSHG